MLGFLQLETLRERGSTQPTTTNYYLHLGIFTVPLGIVVLQNDAPVNVLSRFTFLAPSKFAPFKFAPEKIVPFKSAPSKCVSSKCALSKCAPSKCAPLKLVP
jgi:hypothetical protein